LEEHLSGKYNRVFQIAKTIDDLIQYGREQDPSRISESTLKGDNRKLDSELIFLIRRCDFAILERFFSAAF